MNLHQISLYPIKLYPMSLAAMSLSGAAFILVVAILRAIVRGRLPRKIYLILWGIALARLLVPFSLALPFSSPMPLTATPSLSAALSLSAPSSPLTASPPSSSLSQITASLSPTSFPLPSEASPVPEVPLPIADPGTADSSLRAAVIIQASVSVCIALYFLAGWRRCRREFGMSSPVRNDFTSAWLREHPLRRGIEIRRISGLSTPLTYGIARPVILLPADLDWEKECQLRYMLLHEYLHIRHLDSLWKGIGAAALCIHWWNPLVWVLYLLLNRDIELECDECVVRRLDREKRKEYARTLLQMEGKRCGFVPLGNYFSKNLTEERIRAILGPKKKSVTALLLAGVLMVSETLLVFAAPKAMDAETIPADTVLTEAIPADTALTESVLKGYQSMEAEGRGYYAQTIPGCRYRLFDLDSSAVPELMIEYYNERTQKKCYALATWRDGAPHWRTIDPYDSYVICAAQQLGLDYQAVADSIDQFDLETQLLDDRPLLLVSGFVRSERYTEEWNKFYLIKEDTCNEVFCSSYLLDRENGKEYFSYEVCGAQYDLKSGANYPSSVNNIYSITREEYEAYADTRSIPPGLYNFFENSENSRIRQTDWHEELDGAIAAYRTLLEN